MNKGTFTGAGADERLDPRLKKQMAAKPEERTEMTFIENLKMDLKRSMKSGNFPKRNIIRIILSAIDKEEKKPGGKKLIDVEIEAVIRKECKDMKETIDIINDGGAIDGVEIVKDLELKIEILDEYLTPLMSKEDIITNVVGLIAEFGIDSMKGMGQIMGAFNKKFPGKADNTIVKEVVTEKLS